MVESGGSLMKECCRNYCRNAGVQGTWRRAVGNVKKDAFCLYATLFWCMVLLYLYIHQCTHTFRPHTCHDWNT